MRVPIQPSRIYNGRTVLPVAPPSVSPKWAGLHWTRESWPANAEVRFSLEYFDLGDRAWHPIVGISPPPGDVFELNGALRTEDFIRSAHRLNTNAHGPWFRLDRPMPSLLRAVVETNVPITTALSVDWD